MEPTFVFSLHKLRQWKSARSVGWSHLFWWEERKSLSYAKNVWCWARPGSDFRFSSLWRTFCSDSWALAVPLFHKQKFQTIAISLWVFQRPLRTWRRFALWLPAPDKFLFSGLSVTYRHLSCAASTAARFYLHTQRTNFSPHGTAFFPSLQSQRPTSWRGSLLTLPHCLSKFALKVRCNHRRMPSNKVSTPWDLCTRWPWKSSKMSLPTL